jgi:phage anti-repressor protein
MKIHVYILLYFVKSFSNNHKAQTFKLEYSFNHKIITNTRKHLSMLNILEKNKNVRKDHIKLKHKRKRTCDIGCCRSLSLFLVVF